MSQRVLQPDFDRHEGECRHDAFACSKRDRKGYRFSAGEGVRKLPRSPGEGDRERTACGVIGERVQGGSDECHLRIVALCDKGPLESTRLGVQLFFGEHLVIWLVMLDMQ